jgi:hypothetical protein
MPEAWNDGSTLWILDGSGRQFMAIRDGYGSHLVDVKVYNNMTAEEAREQWRKINTQRSPLNTVDIFLSKYRAGDELEVEIMRIVQENGMNVSKTKTLGVIQSPTSLYEAHKYGVLDRVLNIAKGGFGLWEATMAPVLDGLTVLLSNHRELIDDERMIQRIKDYGGTAKKFVELAKKNEIEFSQVKDKVANSLIRLYNQETKNTGVARLPYLVKKNKRLGMSKKGATTLR